MKIVAKYDLTQTQKKYIKMAFKHAKENSIDLTLNSLRINTFTISQNRISWKSKDDWGRSIINSTKFEVIE